MKNFTVALDSGTPASRNAITNYFAAQQWAYWHWIDDLWIVQVPDTYSPKTLYSQIEVLENIKQATILIFEFQGSINYWGRAKTEAWDWLKHIGTPS
jgi:hypothetical protein